MSAVELKTSVKPQFELKDLKCLTPEPSSLPGGGGAVKPSAPGSRPMGDRENKREPQHKYNMDEEKSKLTKVDKFSYPIHRKRYSQSRAADNHYNKKRRKGNEKIILPTKFLLGGNINDPLNLNSLCDEEVNRALNERTPQSSPVPTPAHRRDVTLIMPRNQFDPLNLNEPDNENEPLSSVKMCAKRKKRHKNRKKNESNIENTNAPTTPLIPKESEKKKHLAEALKIEIDDDSCPVVQPAKEPPQDKPRTPQVPTTLSVSGTVLSTTSGPTANVDILESPKVKPENKIVSPVIPQLSPKNRKRRQASICEGKPSEQNPVSSKNLNRSESCPGEINKTTFARKNNRRRQSHRGNNNKKSQTGNSKSCRFIYGNYNRYYGYRNPEEHDSRLNAFKREWFENKRVLDIGCNIGHLTLFVARELKPQMILGLDIDGRLISTARKNIRHYLIQDDQKYPNSCKLSYGPLAAPVKQEARRAVFPHNVTFAQGSYVLESDELLELQKAEYDLILCMSLTKWIHLNWGDEALKRSFKRMYRQLRPGGKLILEPQSWSSYKKRKRLTETIYNNYCNIKLKPDDFADYLTSPEVGFSNYEIIDVPFNKSKGFQRPIYLFYKDEEHRMNLNKTSQMLNSQIPTMLGPSHHHHPHPHVNPLIGGWSAAQMSYFTAPVATSLSSSSGDTTESAFSLVPHPHHNTEQSREMTTDSSQERVDPSSVVDHKIVNGIPETKETSLEVSTSPLMSAPSTLTPSPTTITPPPSSSLNESSSLAISSSLSSSSSVSLETEATPLTAESKPTETTQRSGEI